MSAKLTLTQIFSKVYPYPTGGRIVKQLVSEKMGEKLTEGTKKVLRFLYKL